MQWIYRRHKFLTRLIFNYQLLENKTEKTQPPPTKTTNQPKPSTKQPTNQGLVKKKKWKATEKAVLMDKTYLLWALKESKFCLLCRCSQPQRNKQGTVQLSMADLSSDFSPYRGEFNQESLQDKCKILQHFLNQLIQKIKAGNCIPVTSTLNTWEMHSKNLLPKGDQLL